MNGQYNLENANVPYKERK